jgi:hypothetical protein
MPSKSKAQHNLMEGVAHNAAFAKKVGIPQSVGRDFVEADRGKKFSKGGADTQPKRQSINQPKTNHGDQALFKKGGQIMAKNQSPKTTPMEKVRTAAPSRDGIVSKGKTKGKVVKMAGNSIGTGKAAKK